MRIRLCLLLTATLGALGVQDAKPTASDVRLQRARSVMSHHLANLPNYTCLLTIERSAKAPTRNMRTVESYTHEDTIHLEVAEVGSKELFGWPGAKLGEAKMEELIGRGLVATGDFAIIANVIFRSEDPVIEDFGEKKLQGHPTFEYSFTIPKERSGYEVAGRGMRAVVAYHGRFWIDPATFQMQRLEVHLDNIPRATGMISGDSVIDYATARIGDSDFLLPARVERVVGNTEGGVSRNISSYTKCHKYETEVTLRFDDPTPPPPATGGSSGDSASAPIPAPPSEVRLPQGVRLPMQIVTAFGKGVATGDLVAARLTEEIHVPMAGGEAVLPAGSEVRGRIHDLRGIGRSGQFALQIEFTEIQTPATTYSFDAFLESVEKRKGVTHREEMTIPGTLLVDSGRLDLSGAKLTYRTMAAQK